MILESRVDLKKGLDSAKHLASYWEKFDCMHSNPKAVTALKLLQYRTRRSFIDIMEQCV
jgi:hypothetical protein